jgi:integrase
MGVYRRGDVWWFKFNWRGEQTRESTKQGNKRIAEQIEAARKSALAKGEVGIEERKQAPTLKEFAPQFTAEIEVICKSKPATISFYKAKLGSVLKFEPLANCRLNKIDEDLIAKYIQSRSRSESNRKKGFAVATINRELATLRRCIRLAHDWKMIPRVPRIRLLRGEKVREFVLDHKDEQRYLEALNGSLRPAATLMLDTGLRVGEMIGLRWSDIRLKPATGARYGYLTVQAGRSKNSKPRNIPLTARAQRTLEALQSAGIGEGALFRNAQGEKLYQTYVNQQHREACIAANFPDDFVLHSLRHTFGTRLGESGADVFTIMKLMGHSSVTVSQRYVHPSPESVERAFDRLETLNSEAERLRVGTEPGTTVSEVASNVS